MYTEIYLPSGMNDKQTTVPTNRDSCLAGASIHDVHFMGLNTVFTNLFTPPWPWAVVELQRRISGFCFRMLPISCLKLS
jgi:hypothetical protein